MGVVALRGLELMPVDLATARRFIAQHHRHNRPPTGWKVGVGLARDGELVGVGILSRPVARKLAEQEPRTIEITRVCTVGDRNANSRLYGALCRAAAALGYTAAVTYTLDTESGVLRAAGFVPDGAATRRLGQTWNMPTRARTELNLFGEESTPAGPNTLATETRRVTDLRFYLGTHQVAWLERLDIPLFVSRRRLVGRRSLPAATAPWALDSGGFTELGLYGEWRTTPSEYVRDVRLYASEIGRLEWVAPQDWMCEPFMLEKTRQTIEDHQRRTSGASSSGSSR